MTDDDTSQRTPAAEDAKADAAQKPNGFRSFFSIPPPVKRIFDQYPLVTYESNVLPIRAPKGRGENVLHVFTSPEDASDGRPSFNPACLKWQAYLKFHGIDFKTVPSSNHASPSGALPFLLPSVSPSESAKAQDAIASNKLKRWIASQRHGEKLGEPEDVRYEAYASLLDTRIRKAWVLSLAQSPLTSPGRRADNASQLYQLYLMPANYPLLHRLYLAPCSSNTFVQMTIAHQLRTAAESELSKASASNAIIEDEIFRDAQEAFEALDTLLGDDEWIFGQEKPGLLDASVFAYAQLLLDDSLEWKENKLGEMLSGCGNLVRHREKIERLYF